MRACLPSRHLSREKKGFDSESCRHHKQITNANGYGTQILRPWMRFDGGRPEENGEICHTEKLKMFAVLPIHFIQTRCGVVPA